MSSPLSSTGSPSSSSSLPSNVGFVVGFTIFGLILLSAVLAVVLWWFSPALDAQNQQNEPHFFAPLQTNDDNPRTDPEDRHVDVETVSSYLGKADEQEKVGLNRSWSVGSFYRRWAKKEAGGDTSDEWWNPLEEEERRERELEQGGSSSSSDHHHESSTRKPSRIARLVSVRWGSRDESRLSDVRESSAERLFSIDGRERGGMVLPPVDDAPTFDDEIEPHIPPLLSPPIPLGPNSINPSSTALLHAARATSYEEDPSPISLTPSFRSYLHLIQRSLSSASFGSKSINTGPSTDPTSSLPSNSSHPLPSTNDESRRVANVQRTASSSTFGPLPLNTSNLPSFHNTNLTSPSSHPSASSPRSRTLFLPSPSISPAVSFGSSFANWVGTIQRSLSRTTTFGSTPSHSNSTRRPSPSVSRAPTSRTFGTGRSRSRDRELEEEEEARLVPPPPLPSPGGRREVMVEEEEDDVTMESHGTLSEEGEVVEVWGRGTVETAVAGAAGSETSQFMGGVRPLPVPGGREEGMEGGGGVVLEEGRGGEKWLKIRRLPVPPVKE